jgi:PTH1 family peptidyl-tRNA hydrolase
MKLIVGLGNPEKKYEKTRHNLGFRVIDVLAQEIKIDDWKNEKRFKALIAQGIFKEQRIILAKPQTFMNNSGQAVKLISDYYKIPISEILIIHDEIDLPLGEIKIQKGRGAAGHKGVESIIKEIKSKDFTRVRIGIKPLSSHQLKINTEKFVLENFTKQEESIVQKTIEKSADLITADLWTYS